MKKLIYGMAAVAISTVFANCSNQEVIPMTQEELVKADYEAKFIQKFGKPSPDQTWGFESVTRTFTRSIEAPRVKETDAPYTAEWVENYLANTGVEANAANTTQNWDGSPDYVKNFKITKTWNGTISVAGSTGQWARTVVIGDGGIWNLNQSLAVGAGGRIIVTNGGTLNVDEGVRLQSTGEAQIVVLRGGKITGKGSVEFANGTSEDYKSYNGGTIDVAIFNNNGGDFYNYGTLKASTMLGGAGLSCYYNHGIISIENTGNNDSSSSNNRIFNACQFYCSGDMRIRNYEGIMGSSLVCDGELMISSSWDGTNDPTYVSLQAGALVQCNTLNNNGTSWSGPSDGGYALLDIIDRIVYLNWEKDNPSKGGYFANNLYVSAGTWDNYPNGNGNSGYNASKKFEIIKNATGNGNVKVVTKGVDFTVETNSDYVKGVSGCTPGFDVPTPSVTPDCRIIAEDLSVEDASSDFDFNDVVFDVKMNYPNYGEHTIILQAAGGTLPLTVGDREVHDLFGVSTTTMVNTGAGVSKAPVTFKYAQNITNVNEIPVKVQKNGQWIVLEALRGKVASKICVQPRYEWCDERKSIDTVYPNFSQWVRGEHNDLWY